MKFSPLHASLLALAVFSVPGAALAASAGTQAPTVLAQADTGAETQNVDAVRKFLANGKDVSQMNEDKLRQRLKRAQRLSQKGDLPPDLQNELQQQIAALQSELDRRGQSSASSSSSSSASPEASQTEGQGQQGGTGQARQKQAQADQGGSAPRASGAGTGDVSAFLQTVRPASELNDKEIRRQVRQAVQLAKTEGISKEQRQALRQVIREGRAALKDKGGDGEEQANGTGNGGTPPQPPQPQPPQQTAEQGGSQPPPAGQPPQQPGKVNPQLEQQAQAMLNDHADVRAMKQPELRKRLTGMRDLLATGQLSPQTSDALRAKLASERQILRNQVSAAESGSEPPQGQGQPPQGAGNNSGSTPPRDRNRSRGPDVDITIVLGDTRPPDRLRDDELVRRIDVYRDVVVDPRYSEIERERWRRQMERDRMFLRQRMLEERRQREAELRARGDDYNIDVEDTYMPNRRPPPPSVFAAEVEDDELTDVLAAPPRRQIDRRYTVDEIERSPQARDAVARIEIDTVHFGFGESFLREEEIDKLDRIARVLEKILAKHPDEVFLLEGHTDAVGTDEANLQLSRERAKAVKEALVTYYVIPAENLKTVGLGERYLKIPTEAPEAENRRVSLARITPLVGRAD